VSPAFCSIIPTVVRTILQACVNLPANQKHLSARAYSEHQRNDQLTYCGLSCWPLLFLHETSSGSNIQRTDSGCSMSIDWSVDAFVPSSVRVQLMAGGVRLLLVVPRRVFSAVVSDPCCDYCWPRPQAKRTLREVDINGDGRISKEEFHHMLTGSPVPDSLDQYDARVFANN